METAQGLSSRPTAATISAAGAGCEIRPWFCDFMVLYGAAIKRMMLRIGGGNYPVIAVRNSVTGFAVFVLFSFLIFGRFRSLFQPRNTIISTPATLRLRLIYTKRN